MKLSRFFVGAVLVFTSLFSQAGIDFSGKVQRVKINEGGRLYFKIDSSGIDDYCKAGWFGFNLYIEKSDKDFPYYYGLLLSAMANNQTVRISNINVFDGTVSCDVIKTGYGIVLNAN